MIFKPGDRRKIFLAGIFVSGLLILVMIFIFLIGEQNAFFEKRLTIHTQVNNAKNLKLGAPVQLKGIKVGTVTSIDFKNVDTLIITYQIAAKYQTWVKQDSYASFKTMGVLGDRFIEILGGTEQSESAQDESHLELRTTAEMDQFITKGEDILIQGTKALTRLNAILDDVDEGRLSKILVGIDKTTKTTQELLQEIDGKKIKNVMTNMEKTTANFAELSERIKMGPGTMHSMIYDPTAYDDLQTLLGGAKRNKVLNYFIKESIKKAQ